MDPDILINAVKNAQSLLLKIKSTSIPTSFPCHHQLGCAIVICACFESRHELERLATPFVQPTPPEYRTLFESITDPKSLHHIRDNLLNGKYDSAKSFYIDLKSVYSALAILSQDHPELWKSAQKMDSFTDDAWMTVVSLQAEKAEIGELENPLPDAHKLFQNDSTNPRPLCLTDTPIQQILHSLGPRLNQTLDQQHPPDRCRSIATVAPPTMRLSLPSCTDPTDNDSDIEVVVHPVPSLKRDLTPDRFPHPPSPSSLTHLPPNKKPRLSIGELEPLDGWLPAIDGIDLTRVLSLVLELIGSVLDHPRFLILDHQRTLKSCIEQPMSRLLTLMKEETYQLASLKSIDQAIYLIILKAKILPSGLEVECASKETSGEANLALRKTKVTSICLQRIYNEVHKFDFSKYCQIRSEPRQEEEELIKDNLIHQDHLGRFKNKLYKLIQTKILVTFPSDSNAPGGDQSSPRNLINQREQAYYNLITTEEQARAGTSENNLEDDDDRANLKLESDILNLFLNPNSQERAPQFSRLTCVKFKTFDLRPGSWIRLFDPTNPSKPIIGQIFDLNHLNANNRQTNTSTVYVTIARYLRSDDIPSSSDHSFFAKEVFRSASFQVHPIEDLLDCCMVLHLDDYLKGRPSSEVSIHTTHFCRYGYNPILQQFTSISELEFQKMMPKEYQKPPMIYFPRALTVDELKVQKKPVRKPVHKPVQDPPDGRPNERSQSDPLGGGPLHDLTLSLTDRQHRSLSIHGRPTASPSPPALIPRSNNLSGPAQSNIDSLDPLGDFSFMDGTSNFLNSFSIPKPLQQSGQQNQSQLSQQSPSEQSIQRPQPPQQSLPLQPIHVSSPSQQILQSQKSQLAQISQGRKLSHSAQQSHLVPQQSTQAVRDQPSADQQRENQAKIPQNSEPLEFNQTQYLSAFKQHYDQLEYQYLQALNQNVVQQPGARVQQIVAQTQQAQTPQQSPHQSHVGLQQPARTLSQIHPSTQLDAQRPNASQQRAEPDSYQQRHSNLPPPPHPDTLPASHSLSQHTSPQLGHPAPKDFSYAVAQQPLGSHSRNYASGAPISITTATGTERNLFESSNGSQVLANYAPGQISNACRSLNVAGGVVNLTNPPVSSPQVPAQQRTFQLQSPVTRPSGDSVPVALSTASKSEQLNMEQLLSWITLNLELSPANDTSEISLTWLYDGFCRLHSQYATRMIPLSRFTEAIIYVFNSKRPQAVSLIGLASGNPLIRGLRIKSRAQVVSRSQRPPSQMDANKPPHVIEIQDDSPQVPKASTTPGFEELKGLKLALKTEILQELSSSLSQSIGKKFEKQEKDLEVLKQELQFIRFNLSHLQQAQEKFQQQVSSQLSCLQQLYQPYPVMPNQPSASNAPGGSTLLTSPSLATSSLRPQASQQIPLQSHLIPRHQQHHQQQQQHKQQHPQQHPPQHPQQHLQHLQFQGPNLKNHHQLNMVQGANSQIQQLSPVQTFQVQHQQQLSQHIQNQH